jgi:hypothetical protein
MIGISKLYLGQVEGTAELSAGTHEIFIEYLEVAGQASYRLSWTCPGATAALPVPPEALWHRPEEDAAVRPANVQVKTLSAAGLEPPERWKDAVNLLALTDPAQDAVHGQWKRQEGGLLMEQTGEEATLELPYQPPEEYTFRVVFVRQSGSANVKQLLTRQGTIFAWTVDHLRRTGFESVGGSNSHPLATTMLDRPLENGREYTSVVQVRRDGARGWLDGKLVAEWKPEFGALSTYSVWALRNSACLGVGGYQCRALFRRIEVLDISGNGKVLRGAPAGGVRSP